MRRMDGTKELEWVSSYLDQELDAGEISAFAEKLAKNPALSDEVADFSQLKQLLKSIPQEKPPRNYTLTRKMAETVRKPGILERLFPVFRFAAMAACVGLVLTFLLPGLHFIAPEDENLYLQKSVIDLTTVVLPEAGSGTDPMSAQAPVAGLMAAEPDVQNLQQSVSDLTTAVLPEADSDMALMSAQAPEVGLMAGEPDMQSFQPTELEGSDVLPVTVKRSSHGVRGGSPKNEMLMTAERMLPDDRSQAEDDSGNTGSASDAQDRLDAAEEQAAGQSCVVGTESGTERTLQVLGTARVIFMVLLGGSLLWMLITWLERKRIAV